ncbi:tRNA glutamyl-Q(34) synthetase GluQRS [Sphingosinicella microcystinivorans]|uniref:Glutamyl-Q tRNA(Asp) synthetase n=1 Tax=Sphingosinicella microcystinivorans TaxID=335406 RepID=A0AAD1G015_SPHMI|nr:tRNA glutamyl-Q(34) synthetase GluQRS [Sphingosinicella microcystinivorans]RKS85531.1 glutamyl-Q tRNA(Asp) synthetase [Sphingosinicella microcystinivorans]BBE33179.1 tRNA glutamyl-Q(34) synthetase GluQRS [Sphingosinicella microcystinivorans]
MRFVQTAPRFSGEAHIKVVTRFAPSPTGHLHLGHAFSALTAFRFAEAQGGRFLLRIEDIDTGRCRAEFTDGIFEDLAWLGLTWETPVRRQSEHMADYAAALTRLQAMEVVYPCFCTRADIAAAVTAPHGAQPLYPGTCRALDPEMRACRMTEPHAWRLDIARAAALTGPLSWHDAAHGNIVATPEAEGDVVLARKDAGTSYHLSVTVDDALQGITDVVRGEDLFSATHIHRLLQALLGLPTPHYHHHGLLRGPDGKRFAKRDRAETLAALRARGVSPDAIKHQLGFA